MALVWGGALATARCCLLVHDPGRPGDRRGGSWPALVVGNLHRQAKRHFAASKKTIQGSRCQCLQRSHRLRSRSRGAKVSPRRRGTPSTLLRDAAYWLRRRWRVFHRDCDRGEVFSARFFASSEASTPPIDVEKPWTQSASLASANSRVTVTDFTLRARIARVPRWRGSAGLPWVP